MLQTGASIRPLPTVNFGDETQTSLYQEIVDGARLLLAGEAEVGDSTDMGIDLALRRLWGLTADEGVHINLELAQLPEGQVIRDLFPNGPPKQVLGSGGGSDPGLAADPVSYTHLTLPTTPYV